jgi:ribosomal protein S30
MTVKQLSAEAKRQGLKGYSGKKKADLVAMLEGISQEAAVPPVSGPAVEKPKLKKERRPPKPPKGAGMMTKGVVWDEKANAWQSKTHPNDIWDEGARGWRLKTGEEGYTPSAPAKPKKKETPAAKKNREEHEKIRAKAEQEQIELVQRRRAARQEVAGDKRYWQQLKKRAPKGERGSVTISTNVGKKDQTFKGTVEGEILNDDWAITPTIVSIEGKVVPLDKKLMTAEQYGVEFPQGPKKVGNGQSKANCECLG